MKISQRQATIVVLGFQLVAITILWLGQLFVSGIADSLTLGAGLAMLIYGGMLFAYLRGWEYARHTSVVLITVVVAAFLPEPFVTMYAPFLILLGPILALVLVDPIWVIGSAVATVGLLLLRAGGVGVYASLTTLLMYAMLIAGLVVSRVIVETAHAHARKAEAQIEYQAHLLRQINDAIVATDDQLHITVWNQGAEKLYGWKTADVLGRNSTEVIRSDITSTEQDEILKQLQERGEYHLELTQYHKDGQPVYVEASVVAIFDENRRVTGLLSVNRDITERKQAEEKTQQQNQRLKALREIDTAILAAESVENIVRAALDHIRELIECQHAALALIDWGNNETVVFDVRSVGKTSISQGMRVPLTLFQDMSQTLSNNQPVLINDLILLEDSPSLFQSLIKEGLRSVCILPLFSQDKLIGTFNISSEAPSFFDEARISLGREVANQVAIAITQNRLIEALEQRVEERDNLIRELTGKNAELERFTYTVSHDLKSPLVTMKGFLGYLEQDAVTGNVERFKGDTKRIANAVDKMSQLLDDMLELSRIGRFVNPPEIVAFDELAREAIELMRSRIEERNITVILQPNLPAVYGDRQRLIEVLQNLLDNAAKYMGDQPEPRIEIGQRGEEAEFGNPIFYVKDNGIGIASEYHERVFGLFNKLDVHTEGTGIGLALVRRIIEFHRGRIWVESEAGMGTTFFFTLPVSGESSDSVI